MVKKWIFFELFLRQYGQKKCLLRYSKKKKRLLRLKKKKDQQEKINDLFPKGLTHALGKKRPIFDGFFLVNIGQENGF